MEREDAERALARAQAAQAEFWDALSSLESALECDVDGTNDLDGVTVDDLLAAEVQS